MDDRLRVSDADRDGAAALLREHFAAGRLTAQELEERLAVILDAVTAGDLRRVLADLPRTAPAPGPACPGPAQAGQLARGYRRLLACYPAWYRRVHEEEMLAVLMTGAPPGRRRPSIAEAADLLWGALRIRCQPSRTGSGPAWRDALAAASVIVPLILVVTVAVNEAQGLLFQPIPPGAAHEFRLWALQTMTTPLAMGVLVPLALRTRRVAALTGAGLLIFLVSSRAGNSAPMADAFWFLAVGLQTAALAASAGPRRGLQILTWKHTAVVVIATLLIDTRLADIVSPAGATVRLIVLTVTGAAMALTSPRGRWLLLLLAIPAWPLFLSGNSPFPSFGWGLDLLPSTAAVIVACYLPPAALAVLAATTARRASEPLGPPDA